MTPVGMTGVVMTGVNPAPCRYPVNASCVPRVVVRPCHTDYYPLQDFVRNWTAPPVPA